MLADGVAEAEGVHADLAGGSGALSAAAEDGGFAVVLAQGGADGPRQGDRRAGGGVLLEAVVGLGDLDVVVAPEGGGDLPDYAEQHVHADGHVGGVDDGDVVGGVGDGGGLAFRQPGRADHHRHAALAAEGQVLHRALG